MPHSLPGRPLRAPSLRLAIVLVTLALVLGFLPAALTFSLDPSAAARLSMREVPVPAWVFVAVWSVIYTGMGLAGWSLSGRIDRRDPTTCVPVAILLASFLISLTFWLTNSLRMTATIDAINALLAGTTLWVVSQYSRAALDFSFPMRRGCPSP